MNYFGSIFEWRLLIECKISSIYSPTIENINRYLNTELGPPFDIILGFKYIIRWLIQIIFSIVLSCQMMTNYGNKYVFREFIKTLIKRSTIFKVKPQDWWKSIIDRNIRATNTKLTTEKLVLSLIILRVSMEFDSSNYNFHCEVSRSSVCPWIMICRLNPTFMILIPMKRVRRLHYIRNLIMCRPRHLFNRKGKEKGISSIHNLWELTRSLE